MKYAKLGTTDIDVSRICLGTMTWGIQNDQADADAQMDMALDMGVNFWDTAEMYPMGAQPSQYGDTETILGDWMRRHASRRGEVVLATKHSPVTDHPTGRSRQISKQSINLALEESLKAGRRIMLICINCIGPRTAVTIILASIGTTSMLQAWMSGIGLSTISWKVFTR